MIFKPTIVEAEPADANELAALHTEALPPGWSASSFEHYIALPTAIVLKATCNSGLAGLAVLRVAADEAEILTLAVGLLHRKRGYARALLEQLIALLYAEDITQIFLEVSEHNSTAHDLYLGCGFHEVARRRDYYRAGNETADSAIIMRRDLKHDNASRVELDG